MRGRGDLGRRPATLPLPETISRRSEGVLVRGITSPGRCQTESEAVVRSQRRTIACLNVVGPEGFEPSTNGLKVRVYLSEMVHCRSLPSTRRHWLSIEVRQRPQPFIPLGITLGISEERTGWSAQRIAVATVQPSTPDPVRMRSQVSPSA